jgi:hypothetical protein
MTTATKKPKPHSCGKCSGSAPCRCCQPVCESFTDAAACNSSSFARPRFFAGQLLTEEDLQDLTGYVLAKNRLHNRYLVGDGVVCGLDVQKHPCNARQVNVGPGYALDCCGNDISVPCPVEGLDIIAMIQELRTQLRGGYDCGDPCRQQENAEKPAEAAPLPTPPQLYDLYLRYCEHNTDLVAPYELESCAAPGCEASRVTEGYTFELRCAPIKVVTDDTTKKKSYAEAKTADTASLRSNLVACLETAEHSNLAEATIASLHTLETVHKALFQTKRLREGDKQQLAALATKELKNLDKELSGAGYDESVRILHRAIVWAIRAKLLALPLDGVNANADPFSTKLEGLKDPATADADAKALLAFWQKYKVVQQAPAVLQLNDALALAGELVDYSEVNKKTGDLNERRRSLLRLAADGVLDMDDEQRSFVSKYEFKELAATAQIGDIEEIREGALKLGYIVFINRQKCFCAALPPPCTPCDDPVVRLARLEVDLQKCRIIHVCNLQRNFALTGKALRYWVSRLQQWFGVFQELCCIPYEKRHQVLNLKTSLQADVERKFKTENEQVAPWRRIPDSKEPLVGMATLTEQVALIAGIDYANIAGALDPFSSPAESTKDLRATREKLAKEIQTLRGENAALLDRFGKAEVALEAAQGRLGETEERLEEAEERVDELAKQLQQVPARSLTEEWTSTTMGVAADRKPFLKKKLFERLKLEGVKALHGKPKGIEGLKEVSANHVLALAAVPEQQHADWSILNVKELLDKETELLKDIVLTPEIRAFWRSVHELKFLTDNWPDPILAEADLT